MTPERWAQVAQTFEELLGLESQARARRLELLDSEDPDLHGEVSSLLRAHEDAQSRFLESPAVVHASAQGIDPPEGLRAGLKVGDYRLVREIGRGGMGEVYLATRADGLYTKEVAVKLVRSGPGTALLLERFRNERQILASLDHPNIARLLDGGTTDDGVPYLAMELVAGVPIDEFCDRHELDVDARLRLFCQVCAAVQYAHRHLVVHRDIKPGNILVTAEGTPKLLDFGIAKILAAAPVGTQTMLHAMTPEYASPEQIRGGAISTAADVYALGVVLYRLLAGRSPFDDRASSPHALAQAICNDEPLRPSLKTSEPKLRRRLQGDLDTIILKALRKEPEERYTLVEQLSDDIQRHLSGLPVAAAKGSWRYRSGKFIARHKGGVAASALLALIVFAAIVAVVREARIAQQEARIAQMQRARAQKRFDDVRQFSNALIFDVHDAIENLPGATPARKLLLDRAVQYLDAVTTDSAGSPDLQRELAWAFQRLAVVQGNPAESNLGDEQASLRSDRKALALFSEVAVANPRTVIDQLNVAMMHRIIAYSTLAEPGGRRDLEAAMAISGRLMATDAANPKVRSERAIEYQDLALLRDSMGDLASGLDAYRENQRIRLGIMKSNPEYPHIWRSAGVTTSMAAVAQARLGARREGLATLEEGLHFLESGLQRKDDMGGARDLAVARQMRGDILFTDGDLPGARAAYEQAAAVLQPMGAADPKNTMLHSDLATTDYRRARTLVLDRQYEEAISLLSQAAAVFDAELPPGRVRDEAPYEAGTIYIWLGDAYAGRGEMQKALQSYRKSTAQASLLDSHPLDATLRCDLAAGFVKTADALSRLGNSAEAESDYRKALEIVTPLLLPAYRNIPAWYVVADLQSGLGQLSAARAQQAHGEAERTPLWAQSRASYESSLATWRSIPNPARFGPDGIAVSRDSLEVQRQLAAVMSHLSGSAQH